MTCPVPFELEARVGAARAGRLRLARGVVPTPVFMPVGTQGAIRTLSPLHLSRTGARIVLANTYHLHQRPGEDLVARHGGLHGFMAIDLPILTDSGGFQVFSLEGREVSEEGVRFRYEVDGKQTFLTPETSMAIQQALGADIAMAFDECLPYGVDRATTRASVDRTARWARRSLEAHTRPDQSLFGIVQGGFWADLRARSARAITALPFDGFAIGGLSVGEGHALLCEVLDRVVDLLPPDRPRYLMGVGRPLDLVEAVARGVDMFDCVIPTRHARGGVAYTRRGRLRITDRRCRRDLYPVDAGCSCLTCRSFTRAYLHHLFRVGEVLGAVLLTHHNVAWFCSFMERMRRSIVEDRFEAFRAEVHRTYPDRPAGAPSGRRKGRRRGGR